MAKRTFNTRMDEETLEAARLVAAAERRSVTSALENAIIRDAHAKGLLPQPQEDDLNA